MGDSIALGLSSLFLKEASRFLFSFLSNFLEVICGIGGGGRLVFILKDLNCHDRLVGLKRVKLEKPDSSWSIDQFD